MAAESPDVIAQSRQHARRSDRNQCPADLSGHVRDCTCTPQRSDLVACWQGAARMARARKTAGLALSAVDRQALDRYPEAP